MPNYTHEEMNKRIKEIRAQSGGRISREEARKQAEAESNYEKPVGQGFQNVEDEVSLGNKFLSPEQKAQQRYDKSHDPLGLGDLPDNIVPPSATGEEHVEVDVFGRPVPPKFIPPVNPNDAPSSPSDPDDPFDTGRRLPRGTVPDFIEDYEVEEMYDPNKWSRLLDRETKVDGIDALAEAAYEEATITEPAQAPEGEEGYDSDALQQVGPFQEGNEFSMDETRERWAEEDKQEEEEKKRTEEYDKKFDEHTKRQKKYRKETPRIIQRHDEESKERLSQPGHPGHVSDEEKRHIKILAQHEDNIRRGKRTGGPISPEDSEWIQRSKEEDAKHDAEMDIEMDKRTKGIMDDEMADVQRRLNQEKKDENRALIAAGHEPGGTPIAVTETTEGTVGGGLYEPDLKDRIEVKDKDDITKVIFRDKLGAREELARRKGAEGKVRMRQAEGGYARAADDEPYREGDIHISESEAGRAESTAEKRIREKARRKGLLARNKLLDKGWRDPKSPFAYGKDAAAVRIAQISADAQKAKAEAEAKIKADDTLNAHQKQLAIIKAQAEIDSKEATEQRAFDAEQAALKIASDERVLDQVTGKQDIKDEEAKNERKLEHLNQQLAVIDQNIANPATQSDLADYKIEREKKLEEIKALQLIIQGNAPAQTSPTASDGPTDSSGKTIVKTTTTPPITDEAADEALGTDAAPIDEMVNYYDTPDEGMSVLNPADWIDTLGGNVGLEDNNNTENNLTYLAKHLAKKILDMTRAGTLTKDFFIALRSKLSGMSENSRTVLAEGRESKWVHDSLWVKVQDFLGKLSRGEEVTEEAVNELAAIGNALPKTREYENQQDVDSGPLASTSSFGGGQ